MSDLDSKTTEVTTSEAKADVVDAVFVIGTGSNNNNEELRYALRDLARFCPFIRDVYISGECPSWINTAVVKHLKWPDRFHHAKDANIIDKLRHACEHPGIAKKILFCSDDQFVTRECSWEDFTPRWLRRYVPSDTWYDTRHRVWHTRLHKTLDRDRKRRLAEKLNPDNVFYYQPHMWMQIDRDLFIEYAKWSGYETREDTIIASGYFNFIDADGKFNYDHEFIAATHNGPMKTTHIAYSDGSFGAAMKYLRETFREPCRFELIQGTQVQNQESAVNNKSTSDSADRSIAKRITREDILNIDKSEPIVASLLNDIKTAEDLRNRNVEGWKIVWDDIIDRWITTTDNGRLYIPITMPFSSKAQEIIKKASTNNMVESNTSVINNSIPGEHKCAPCEARKKAAETIGAAGMRSDRLPHRPMPVMRESESCVDCAIDHLSVAIAYLNSDVARPSRIDVLLAKGEVQVAANNLFTPRYLLEYNNCIEALESTNSANSKFSAAYLLDILKRVVDKAH